MIVTNDKGWYSLLLRYVLCFQISEEVLKTWVQQLIYFCGDEQETEMLLAAAEVLKSITSLLLINEKLVLGELLEYSGSFPMKPSNI